MIKLLLVFTNLICISVSAIQEIQFIGEGINFSLDNNIFEVKGKYYFSNPSEKIIQHILYYPFPDDKKFSNPYDIIASLNGENTILSDSISARGFLFKIRIEPHDTTICRISYKQELYDDHAIYLLSTTRSWAKPLAFGQYRLTTPEDIILDSLSFAADSISIESGNRIYYIDKTDFLPDRDFYIRFRK